VIASCLSDFDAAYREPLWRDTIRRVVEVACRRFGLREFSADELECDAWSRIWRRWARICVDREPLRAAGTAAYQVCVEAVMLLCGRTVVCRGKKRRWGGLRRSVAFSQVRGKGGGSLALLYRRSRGLGPLSRSIVREEIGRFGGDVVALLHAYGARRWAREFRLRGGLDVSEA
jgi:hypothetical protein